MKHGRCIRWTLLLALVLVSSFSALPQALPSVTAYSPPATTVGSLPGVDLPLTVSLTSMPTAVVEGSPRAVWWQGASSTPISVSSYTGTSAIVLVPPALRSVAGGYTVQVCATALGAGPPVETCTNVGVSATFTINAPPVFTIAPSLPNAVQNTDYSVQLSVTGGTPGDPGNPYNWSVEPGSSIPPGLFLNEKDGNLSNVTTTVGTFTFTIRATDMAGVSTLRTFTLVVRPPLQITTVPPLPPATRGVAYSTTISAVGGSGTFNWELEGSLPTGLILAPDGANTLIVGTPGVVGSFSFMIGVVDGYGNFDSETFTITISDPLEITTESPLPDGVEGSDYYTRINRSGGNFPFTWSISAGSLPPGLNLEDEDGSSYRVITGVPTTAGTFSFSIRVQDEDGRVSIKPFSLTIRPPLAITSLSPLPPATVGTAYTFTFAGTGGFPPYFWFVGENPPPPGLTLNEGTGVLSGIPSTPGSYEFEIFLGDSSENSVGKFFTLDVAPPLEITTTSPLPNAVAEAPYETVIAATGGRTPYAWSLAPGSTLPTGLNLNVSTGAISGIPATPGAYNFSIRVTDADARQVTRAFALTVTEPLRIITESPLPPGTEGVAYNVPLVASGGLPPFVWSTVGGVPVAPGLTLSESGVIAGTPSAAGSFSFTARVMDSLESAQTRTFTILVGVPLQILTSSPLPPVRVGAPYSFTLQAIGGNPPYQWMLNEGASLPAGLSLSSAGVLSGTVSSPGTFTLPITVMDASENTASRVFELQAGNLLTILTPSPLPAATQGESYSVTIEAIGGDGSYAFSVVPGTALPPGLALAETTGVIAGVPTQSGAFSFGIAVTDGQGAQEIRTFSLTVVGPLTITTASPLPPAVPATAYSVTFAATGGVGPYVFGEQPGTALPPGLSLAGGTGVLSGTPTQAGEFTFGIRVFDSRGVQVSKTFQLLVTNELSITTASPLPGAERGVAYSQTIQAVGGSTPYVFSTDPATVPPGLSLNPNTGVLSGTPSVAGNLTFTVTVTDAQAAQASRAFTLSVSGALRFLTTSPLPGGTVGQSFTLNLQADGGVAPYRFAVATGVLPEGISLTEAGLLSGTPGAPFNGSITFRVTDSGAVPASAEQAFAWRITAPLEILTSSLPNGLVGQAYSQTVQAQGGTPAYTFRISSGSLPAGIAISSTGLISGTPTAAGTANFTVEATDQDSRVATRSLSITVLPVVVSGGTVRPANPTPAPNSQVPVQVEITEPANADLDGLLTMVFNPSTTPPADDPAVRFVSGSRTVTFRIPAGTRTGLFGTDPNSPPIQTGTVAGEIRVSASLSRGGLDATPTPTPLAIIPVPAVAPVITDLSVTRSATGLTVVIRGFSTPRNMTSATLTFTARPGANTPGSLTQTVNLSAAFTTWYSNAASIPHGSRFQLTLPVTIAGDPTEIVGVSVQLQNSSGAGNTVNATF